VFLFFKQLGIADVKLILKRAIKDKKRGLGNLNLKIKDKDIGIISQISNGDARIALNILEYAAEASHGNITLKIIEEASQK